MADTPSEHRLWTLDELTAEVALALSQADDYRGSLNGQVRTIPDRRTIRYYRSLGILDRPAEMRGRTAFYGRRHLLQLVAIKRLQARGRSLKEIQERLTGLPDSRLRAIARLDPVTGPAPATARPAASTAAPPSRRRQAFWAAPAPPDAGGDTGEADPARPVLTGVPVDPLLTLLVPLNRPLDAEDWQAVTNAAQPLLKVLCARHLVAPPERPDTKETPDAPAPTPTD